jgi:hypothetical protein
VAHRRVLDLARVDQALGGAEHRRQGDLHLEPAVVVLEHGLGHQAARPLRRTHRVRAPRRDDELLDAGGEGAVEQLRDLRADLTRVGVDRVAAHEHQVELGAALGLEQVDRRREGPRGRQRVGAGERGVAHQHARVGTEGDGFAQDVLGRRRSHRDDGARPAAGGREGHPLGHRPPAVRAHLEIEALTGETTVGTQAQLLEHRDSA